MARWIVDRGLPVSRAASERPMLAMCCVPKGYGRAGVLRTVLRCANWRNLEMLPLRHLTRNSCVPALEGAAHLVLAAFLNALPTLQPVQAGPSDAMPDPAPGPNQSVNFQAGGNAPPSSRLGRAPPDLFPPPA